MERLSAMSMLQNKFDQAGYFYWVLAKENAKEIKAFKDPNEIEAKKIQKFKSYIKNASVYKAYQLITEFINRPLKIEKYPGYNAAVYNSARLILGFSQISNLEKVSLTEVNYVFAKTAVLLGGKKAARVALEKLNQYVIQDSWVEELEVANLKARAGNSGDSNDTILRCFRCGNKSEVIAKNNTCGNCFHPLLFSPLSFANLPLVEFEVTGDMTHEQIMEHLAKKSTAKRAGGGKKQKMWDFNMEDGEAEQGDGEKKTNELKIEHKPEEQEGEEMEDDTPFTDKLTEACDQ